MSSAASGLQYLASTVHRGPAESKLVGVNLGCQPAPRSDADCKLAKRNLAQLTVLVKARLTRMQYRPGLLEGFLVSTGLDLTPFCSPRN